MSFTFEEKHETVLSKYFEIWKKIKDLIRRDFDVQVTYYDKYIPTWKSSFKDEIRTDYLDDRLPSGNNSICSSFGNTFCLGLQKY